ncbi:hypothetical protein M422DRAFT_253407 [Sphaerobolus stellatus SS14]|uniref:Uncharacterized protein n=1 Tax=Sphaerobolus stellatus (strain SS14) TaxID=990650 RepID=A0A0C9UJH8_SPHS4|nr:hypothetical protein M422DRAFT_253407 [Sphaerobolus stellatus SS14]
MLTSEHPDDPHATAYGSQTAPSREQSPSRGDVRTAHRGSHTPPKVASITATQGRYSPRGITHRSESRSNSEQVSPTGGDTTEDFIIRGSEVIVLRQEYSEFITLKDNAEIVLAEAMEATERLNTVFNRVRASMSRMSPRMKELFSVPSNQESGKTLEPSNNRAHDKAAAQAATQRIIDQTSMADPAPGSGAEERARATRSRVPGDQYSRAPLPRNIPEDIPHCSRRSIAEPQSIDMNALREEIKATISATIKDKLRSEADSVTTVSQSMQALDSNAQYWSDLSNKAARCSRRALELQLKLAEEKVNNLLHEGAPEEALLEAAREARNICFQLDQSSRLREAGLMPEQQVRFSANTGRNIISPSRNYGPNPIIEPHIPQSEINAQFGRQSTPALSINAQLDGAVVDMTSEYSGIQQMVRQVLQNASLEDEPEKSFLAKAGVKMGNPPTYGDKHILNSPFIFAIFPYFSHFYYFILLMFYFSLIFC